MKPRYEIATQLNSPSNSESNPSFFVANLIFLGFITAAYNMYFTPQSASVVVVI